MARKTRIKQSRFAPKATRIAGRKDVALKTKHVFSGRNKDKTLEVITVADPVGKKSRWSIFNLKNDSRSNDLLLPEPKLLYAESGLDDYRTRFSRQLDALDRTIDLHPELRAEFEKHAVFKKSTEATVIKLRRPPKVAPKLWKKKENRDSSPAEFIQRYYAEWMGRGLVQADIAKLDPRLYGAFHQYLQTKPTLPNGFYLPTREDWNARLFAERGLFNQLSRDEQARLLLAMGQRYARAIKNK